MSMNCQHCGQPLLDLDCDACYGTGYLWRGGDVAVTCFECRGSGEEHPCTNTECPGIIWYPLNATDRKMYRMVVRSVERDETK